MPVPWLDRLLLSAIQRAAGPAGVRIVVGTSDSGTGTGLSNAPIVRISDRGTLVTLARNPQVNFGDLYSQGRIEVDGDLVDLVERLYQAPVSRLATLQAWLLGVLQTNTLQGSHKNIHHHYDLSNDFYRLWLDREMLYTCAYFPDPGASLEEAQLAKMDHVCRKLWLRPGEQVVEAGCGWGALALHMAGRYGVKVKAFNISGEQIAFARDRARREGLSSRVEFIEDDYRNITGSFDAFVSVGMLEHVGKVHHPEFARVIHRTIGNRGRGLLHFIGRNRPRPLNAWIRRRIFPGGYPPCLREVAELLEPGDYSVLDIENLRLHYARTLECWLERFEANIDQVKRQFSASFARMWRLYLSGSIAAFRVGSLQLFQVVFAGRQCVEQPWSRAYLYNGSEEAQDETCVRVTS